MRTGYDRWIDRLTLAVLILASLTLTGALVVIARELLR